MRAQEQSDLPPPYRRRFAKSSAKNRERLYGTFYHLNVISIHENRHIARATRQSPRW